MSGRGVSNACQPHRKAILAFSGGEGNLPVKDCHPAGSARSWGPRWTRRDPDIHSGLVGAVFLRIGAPSYVVQTGLLKGWYPSQHREERLERASRGPPMGLGGRADAKSEPLRDDCESRSR